METLGFSITGRTHGRNKDVDMNLAKSESFSQTPEFHQGLQQRGADSYPWEPLSSAAQQKLDEVLLAPLNQFLSRSGKRFRAQMLRLGYELAGGSVSEDGKKLCALAEEVLECVHAGSLIVDDVQDRSRERRGKPAYHVSHGVASAINAGNWLYFWPNQLIRRMGLTPERELIAYRLLQDMLLSAHCGQALDVGISMETVTQNEARALVMDSLRLKSGALTGYALEWAFSRLVLRCKMLETFCIHWKWASDVWMT